MVDGPGGWDEIGHLADHLEEGLEEEANHIATLLRKEMAPYADLPSSEVLPGVTTSLRYGLAALRDRRLPSPDELDQLASVAEARARQGIPLELVLSAYRIGAHEVWATASIEGRRRGLNPTTLLEAVQLVWSWTDAVTAHAAAAHRRAEVELARHHEQYRTNFLRGVITGSLAMPELAEQARGHGLDPRCPHRAFRAVVPATTPLYLVERSLLQGGAIVIGIADGGLSGLATDRIVVGELPVTVGMGPLADLSDLRSSFSVASRVLAAATGFGLTGVHDLESLSLKLPIANEEAVGDALVDRYFGPLRDLRRSGIAIEQSVAVYLAEGLRVDPTARRLFVHPNTLRYRLARFEDLTGADLSRTETVVEVWWALERRRLEHGSGPIPA
ncbi:MAG: PucR family transcriptional regulator [Acidimicrobiales bacterium]